MRLKKNALEEVNFEQENKKDPKFKTELCKTFEAKGFCVYGNKCRFAHGRQEIFDRANENTKYKQKQCNSFYKNFYCVYGPRCHFIHDEKKLNLIPRSYYSYLLQTYHLETQFRTNSISNFNNPFQLFSYVNLNSDFPTANTYESPDISNLKSKSSSSVNSVLSKETEDSSINTKEILGKQKSRRLTVFNEICKKNNVFKNLNEIFCNEKEFSPNVTSFLPLTIKA